MHKGEIIQYSRQYLPDERAAAAEDAWEAFAAGDNGQAKEVAQEFYATAEQAAAEDARAFDVQTLAAEHGAVLVSAIRTYGNLGPFRPQNREDFKGARLFDILLRPDQIACCSTVLPGDTADNIYSSWGVIVGRGTIQQAFPYDATTSVQDGQVSSRFMPRIAGIRPAEQIEQALYARHGSWNEVTSTVDAIAGLFYCADDGHTPSDKDYPSKAMHDMVAPLDIPQYLLRNGVFHRIGIFEDIAAGNVGEAVQAAEIVQRAVQPTKEQRNDMITHLADTLTLAPRNAITSGVARGQFVYDHRRLTCSGGVDSFLREQRALIQQDNPSLRLYGAMALHAFAETAETQGDTGIGVQMRALAETALGRNEYSEYKARILESGNLRVSETDLRHYLATGTLPPYLQDH